MDEYGQVAVAEAAPHKQADPFDYDGAHVDPNRATDPGLVNNINTKDQARFFCTMGYNETAIASLTRTNASPALCQKTKNLRIVSNVGPALSIYTARIEAPSGTDAIVEPSILVYNSGVKKIKSKV
ncbi:hypothetical protein MIMGU_mgv1a022582mg [Erythranthe guttata]|uniref:Subtilisin-like protease fibronectin type-III domain-containing protein n=1 Tax=Erythranthe guttata TaxID=4155 RepID=A0A022RBZ3_ERYGU|nr:hypothetical protein MIMGU_mgv1a022582mg [Erythranthe guttata]